MEAMEGREAVSAAAGLGQGRSAPLALSDNPQAMLTVMVEVEQATGSGPEEICHPTFLLEGPNSIRLLQLGTLETQVEMGRGVGGTGEDGSDTANPSPAHRNNEAEQELLAQVQSQLGYVGRGYSVGLLLRGRETEAPRLVPQLLQMLFEEALSLGGADPVLSTLSLVQLSPSGRTRDLLSPGEKNLSVLDVVPLGLVVEDASEVEVSDSKAASELYLQATGVESRDCPLLQVLAGKVNGEEVEGSLPWIVSWLLEGNNYSGLLLRLGSQGSSLSLLQAALLGAAGRRMQVKQVRPTLWDAAEEARARRAGLKSLRLGLLGDTLSDGRLNQLGRALRELQVVKAWSQRLRNWMLKGVKAEAVGLLEPQMFESQAEPQKYFKQGGQHCSHFSVAGRTTSLGPGPQKHSLRDSEEQAQQVPDVALQFFLAQARRQRLREQQQIWIQEELKHLEKEEAAGDQVKGLVAGEEATKERQRWHREQTVLRLQLEALQAERDTAEQDLLALYDLHVQATRARTCHVLQVFRAWRRLWEEQTMTTEQHHRSLLAGVLQDSINLAAQNQELQAQNQQLQQAQTRPEAVMLDRCPGEKSGDQESFRGSFLSPHS
ncbi:hypothetical protein mRhiFer1_009315 [Rhinolophus ferrumequinum]|uniref:Uncharacterized protein n=1 Tax=Rhinolophus ferrumequinum TaxID=59479 RepID=A0A7J7RXK8_RHIFE|nr:hypothetical protein mRhiFer1_009315 [Rhinolophus ferrumequinum]